MMQSLVPNSFAIGQALHKAYDEVRDFCKLLSHSHPIASLLDKLCIKPTTKSKIKTQLCSSLYPIASLLDKLCIKPTTKLYTNTYYIISVGY